MGGTHRKISLSKINKSLKYLWSPMFSEYWTNANLYIFLLYTKSMLINEICNLNARRRSKTKNARKSEGIAIKPNDWANSHEWSQRNKVERNVQPMGTVEHPTDSYGGHKDRTWWRARRTSVRARQILLGVRKPSHKVCEGISRASTLGLNPK